MRLVLSYYNLFGVNGEISRLGAVGVSDPIEIPAVAIQLCPEYAGSANPRQTPQTHIGYYSLALDAFPQVKKGTSAHRFVRFCP